MGVRNIFSIADDLRFKEELLSLLSSIGSEGVFDRAMVEFYDSPDRWKMIRWLELIDTTPKTKKGTP